ncbi:hypothetical protein [Bradyrhizobium sp. 164]|uniref:hypothetical protein n=1 Tax=Bradyrhizobium sp. 164 TaxID=2782637 RepID=UPI001FF988BC|nr:hypothetical protein [Bradyrhizobium sp. 164]MCK1597950.1 hypothetical protein [Bradyrhizobium sp. 164]
MSTIDTDNDFIPAAVFMESAAMDLQATTSFLVDNADVASKLGVMSGGAVRYTVTVDVSNPDLTAAFTLPLHMVIDPPALASKIVRASRRGKLRLEGFQVVDGFFTQPRLVLLIRRRVVGQLYCSRDGQSLELEIRERPDARDMGNAVLALGCLSFNVHTPLGSAPADRVH